MWHIALTRAVKYFLWIFYFWFKSSDIFCSHHKIHTQFKFSSILLGSERVWGAKWWKSESLHVAVRITKNVKFEYFSHLLNKHTQFLFIFANCFSQLVTEKKGGGKKIWRYRTFCNPSVAGCEKKVFSLVFPLMNLLALVSPKSVKWFFFLRSQHFTHQSIKNREERKYKTQSNLYSHMQSHRWNHHSEILFLATHTICLWYITIVSRSAFN